jgi:Helix-turn-helix domain
MNRATSLTTDELLERLNSRPMVPLVPDAADALDISPRTAYTLAASGRFPVEVLRVGNQWRVPTAGLRRLLGVAS